MQKSFLGRKIKKLGLKVLYYGKKRYCLCCGRHSRKFLPMDNRKNAYCPNCGSVERHRLILIFLKEKTSFFRDRLRVLHVGPNMQIYRNFKQLKNIEYICIDLNPRDTIIKMDVTALKFDDDSFDVILCNHVLEHVNDDRLAMKELFRVLKPGGFGILQVPIDPNLKNTYEDFSITDPELRKKHFGQEVHCRSYGLDYKDRLKETGFKLEILKFENIIEGRELNIQEFGLNINEDLYYVSK